MSDKLKLVVPFATLVALCLLVPACKTPGYQLDHAVVSLDRTNTDDSAAVQPDSHDDDSEKDSERARKRAKLRRELEIAVQKLHKARMAAEHAEITDHADIAKSEADLDIARRKREKFTQHDTPTRVQSAQLALQRSHDSTIEAEEELTQLEMMYAEEHFADKTKEIVLERGKRRLKRSRRNLEIKERQLLTLREQTLPIEAAELDLKIDTAERTLDKSRRQANATRLAKQIDRMAAESEIARIEAELEALEAEDE